MIVEFLAWVILGVCFIGFATVHIIRGLAHLTEALRKLRGK